MLATILLSPPNHAQQLNVGGAATTVQLPTFGVAIDAEGVLDVNALRKANRLLVPAGGGVSIVPDDALEEKHLQPDKNGAVGAMCGDVGGEKDGKGWWWD